MYHSLISMTGTLRKMGNTYTTWKEDVYSCQIPAARVNIEDAVRNAVNRSYDLT